MPRRRSNNTAVNRSVSKGVIACSLLALLIIFALHTHAYADYVNDDAFISFRYAASIVAGRGPYFNAGEHVEGYSNPLLVWLLVPAIAIAGAGAAAATAKLIGVTCGAVVVVAVYGCVRELAERDQSAAPVVAGVVAAGLVTVSPGYAVNTVNGLETTLYAVATIVGVWLACRGARQGRWHGAGLAFAAAVLSRPEGALVFAVFWVALVGWSVSARRWAEIRAQLFTDLAIVGVTIGILMMCRRIWYDGAWLPNTYYAKMGGFADVNVVGAWQYIADGILAPFGGLVATTAGFVGYLCRRGHRWRAIPVAIVAAAGILSPFATGTDWMVGERLVTPYIPLAAVVVALGWQELASRVFGRARLAAAILIATVPVLGWVQAGTGRELADYVSTRARGYRDGHAAMANWLCTGRAHPGDTIALTDIGIVGYRCMDQRILDITGLTDRFIARSPGTFLDKQYDVSYILDQRPRFIVVFLSAPGDPDREPPNLTLKAGTRMDAQLLRHPAFKRDYVELPQQTDPSEPWLDRLAKQIGALRVFQHAHPGAYYLLAVFERRPTT